MENRDLLRAVRLALREDKAWQDLTAHALPQHGSRGEAVILAQQTGILAGGNVARAAFKIRDRRLSIKIFLTEGSRLHPGQRILSVRGSLRSILSAERTALNFLSRLSGVATMTHRFVQAVRGTGVPIYDTRKTTPGLRALEKYAVKTAGGSNHRMDLASAVLLKDNHLKAMHRSGDSPLECLKKLRKTRFKNKIIEMEAQNLGEVWDAIAAGVDFVLLDNLDLVTLQKAMQLVRAAREVTKSRSPLATGRSPGGLATDLWPQVEVSGGINLSNIRAVARLKPDRISVGMITHSAPGINFNLELT